MTGCRFQDIWKDQCETARGVPEHLTALAELRTTKLAGGDIHLPTYSRQLVAARPTSIRVRRFPAPARPCIWRSSRNAFRHTRRLMHWATYRDAFDCGDSE